GAFSRPADDEPDELLGAGQQSRRALVTGRGGSHRGEQGQHGCAGGEAERGGQVHVDEVEALVGAPHEKQGLRGRLHRAVERAHPERSSEHGDPFLRFQRVRAHHWPPVGGGRGTPTLSAMASMRSARASRSFRWASCSAFTDANSFMSWSRAQPTSTRRATSMLGSCSAGTGAQSGRLPRCVMIWSRAKPMSRLSWLMMWSTWAWDNSSS